jgi:hypothetical protein
MSWHWFQFIWLAVGFLILCFAIYGAWVLFNPPQCELGIGALLQ